MAKDYLQKFLFDKFPVRGALLKLDKSWKDVLEVSGYSPPTSLMLGKTIAAAGLLTSNLKFEGTLSLQIQSAGQLRLIVGECTDRGHLRGVVRLNDPGSEELPLLKDAVLSINLQQEESGQRYQGIVPFEDGSLSKAVEGYFLQSEQLETRLWLAVDNNGAAGMLLQKMPGDDPEGEHWSRINILADTLSDEELLGLDSEALLGRLFHEEEVRIFKPGSLEFNCSCSRERVTGMLRALGEEEVLAALAERHPIEVRCEYCDRAYEFDAVDAAEIFASDDPTPPTAQALQ